MKIFVLLLLVTVSVFARLTDNQVEIKTDKDSINITVKKGFHLNAEAPASAAFDNLEAIFKPTVKTEALFTFNKIEKAKTANLSFYICDDKKTVCEQHKQTINLKNGEVKKEEIKAQFSNIKDFSLASKDGRPTLLVFSAPWCPACIRMQTETYNKAVVQKEIKKFNFVKLNSDVTENYELSEKFKIKAIPTMIMLDKNGIETYRWLDFQAASDFAKSLSGELKKVDLAEVTLKNARLGDSAAASKLAFKAFNTLDYAEALKWFNLTKSEKDKKFKLASEVSLAAEKSDEDKKLSGEYLDTLEKAISSTTSRLDHIRWTIDYLEKKKELKATGDNSKKAEVAINEIDKLLKNPKRATLAFNESTYGNYGGFEQEELLWLKARVYGILDKTTEKEQSKRETIALIFKRKLSAEKPGEMLVAISYLREAGEIKKVDELYQRLINQYNNSYVYFEKYARFVQKNKNLEKALDLTNEALKYPEGNKPQLTLLKSQLLKDLNKKNEAISLIDEALNSNDIQHKRFATTVKKLNDLKAELSK
jgi:thiol-disulfide isomerase/thioredoxin